jgi:hypothetical protein
VFKQGHPAWLGTLITRREGRQLIYDLSLANRNSLLLNYAIQRILKMVRVCMCACVHVCMCACVAWALLGRLGGRGTC